MDKKDLIKQCRYYKGEENNPYTQPSISWFWDMERHYVKSRGLTEGQYEYYENIGGKKYPGIPYPLLIAMFTSWGKFTYDIKESIDNFYELIDEYLFIANDHYPEDKIPNQ